MDKMEELACYNCGKEYYLEDIINDFDGENFTCHFCGNKNKKRASELYYKYKKFFEEIDELCDSPSPSQETNLRKEMENYAYSDYDKIGKLLEKHKIDDYGLKELFELKKLIGE